MCWNWQTGTFEGRVFMTYGFKSRHSHHKNKGHLFDVLYFFIERDLNPKRAYAVKQKLPVASFVGGSCAVGYCERSSRSTNRKDAKRLCPVTRTKRQETYKWLSLVFLFKRISYFIAFKVECKQRRLI